MREAETKVVREAGVEEPTEKVEALPEASGKLRVLARGVDYFIFLKIITICVLLLFWLVMMLGGQMSFQKSVFLANTLLVLIAISFLWCVLEALAISKLGGTPGKLLLGMRVFKSGTDERVPFAKAFKRSAAVLASMFFGYSYYSIVAMPWWSSILYRGEEEMPWDKKLATQVVSIRSSNKGLNFFAAVLIITGMLILVVVKILAKDS